MSIYCKCTLGPDGIPIVCKLGQITRRKKHLCRTNQRYRVQFIELSGQTAGWGDIIAVIAHRLGFDKLARKFSRKPSGCGGCAQRHEKLNRVSSWLVNRRSKRGTLP